MARIAGIDLPNDKRVEIGLTYIYGIGRQTANEILKETKVNPDTRVKDLTEEEIGKIRSYIEKNCVVEDEGIISIIISSLKMFNRLKYINFSFTDNPEIKESYNAFLNRGNGKKGYIYKVDRLEMNLSDMFSQWVIDLLNRVFICNEIIPNSYLERKFCIDFTYDEYMSFIDMFLSNNESSFDSLDKNICEYFKSFPTLINDQKPNIRLITNYSDEVTV